VTRAPDPFSAQALAAQLGGRLVGEDRTVARLSSPDAAQSDAVVVVPDARALSTLAGRQVGVLVIPEALAERLSPPYIVVAQPRLALAQLSALFSRRPPSASTLSLEAHIDPTAELAEGVAVAPGAVVMAGARLGAGVVVGAGCVVGTGSVVGAGSVLHPNVTLYDGVRLGERVIVHSGAVIGADGFGYAPSQAGAVKIHHLGTVEVGDDVEIGAGTCIDRATLGATRIGARSKIDNLCQIAHNVHVGSDCLIAGMVGIAGSTRLGDRVTVGGAAAIGDHLTIGTGATIAGRAGVTKDVPPGETWAGFPAAPYRKWVRELYLLSRLELIWQRFKGEK
jgi:UDP-3-O-[3-hydroxymyristoyl] glucosamine N-acyltransferase